MTSDDHVDVLEIGGYPPPHGGVSIHVQELSQRLERSGISACVLSNTPAPDGRAEPSVHRFGGSRPRQFAAMLRLAAGMKPGLVHVHVAYGANALPWAALFAGCARKDSLITIHSGLFPAVMARQSGLARSLNGRALDSFSVIIAVSSPIREALVSLGISPAKIRVIPAFFAPDHAGGAAPDGAVADLRRRCRVLLFTSGSMHPDWGILTVARALNSISDLDPGLIIVQSGETRTAYEEEVRAVVADPARVVFYRDVPHEKFLAILASADIYVRASLYDGDSNAVREALGCGKLVVASDCVPRPSECLLFATGSQPALDTALRKVLREPPTARCSVTAEGSEALLPLYRSLLQ